MDKTTVIEFIKEIDKDKVIRYGIPVTAGIVGLAVCRKIWKTHFKLPPVPKLENTWWGHGKARQQDIEIRPFKINISDDILKDLEHRLANTMPFQQPLEGVNHNYGINTNLLKDIVEFWQTKYNWREREAFLNQYPQFTVDVQGLKIHYLHVKPKEIEGVKVLPLLLLHGWPGSVREFYEIIPLLTTLQKGRDFVFEVIAPSLPGYGFSEAAVRPGLGSVQVAVLFKNFMKNLGYDKYYIQGGDWGGIIVQNMATFFPEHIIGMHSTLVTVNNPIAKLKTLIGGFFPRLIVSKKNEPRMYPRKKIFEFNLLESGYLHIQATKPDTVGVALRESPAGLAAYILEKFITWTNHSWKDLEDGGLAKKYTLTNLLDNVMIYWVTRSITTSMRLYSETFSKAHFALSADRFPVYVPSGHANFSYDLGYQPDTILKEKFKKFLHSADYEGGHFSAFEVPEILAKDIYMFVEKVEKLNKTK